MREQRSSDGWEPRNSAGPSPPPSSISDDGTTAATSPSTASGRADVKDAPHLEPDPRPPDGRLVGGRHASFWAVPPPTPPPLGRRLQPTLFFPTHLVASSQTWPVGPGTPDASQGPSASPRSQGHPLLASPRKLHARLAHRHPSRPLSTASPPPEPEPEEDPRVATFWDAFEEEPDPFHVPSKYHRQRNRPVQKPRFTKLLELSIGPETKLLVSRLGPLYESLAALPRLDDPPDQPLHALDMGSGDSPAPGPDSLDFGMTMLALRRVDGTDSAKSRSRSAAMTPSSSTDGASPSTGQRRGYQRNWLDQEKLRTRLARERVRVRQEQQQQERAARFAARRQPSQS